MKNLIALTKRNIRLYLRDKAAIFFSFLSTIIMVALYFLFIAKMYGQSMTPENGLPFSDAEKNFLIYLQMMAGVLILSSMSLSLGSFSTIAKDFESRQTDSFLIMPLKNRELLFSYFIAGFITSFALNFFMWMLSSILIGALTGYWIGVGTFAAVIGILAVASLVSCALMLLITGIVKSSTAIGVISSIAGTLFGFLCGIYMPYSNLGTGTEKVGSFLPFTHLTIWLKQTVLSDAFSKLNITGEAKDILLKEYFSANNIGFCGIDIPLWAMLILCGVFALVCFILASRLLKKRITK
jgi:multidrug/hemolysin transport system permease protein